MMTKAQKDGYGVPHTSGFLRLRQVLQLIPIGRSTLYQKMKVGAFPSAIKLGPRITAWRAEDIHEYLRDPTCGTGSSK